MNRSSLSPALFILFLLLYSFSWTAEQSRFLEVRTYASNIGPTLLKSPYTYHALAPATLYAGYALANLSVKAVATNLEKIPIPVEMLMPFFCAGIMAAYYAPSYALTECMRKNRENITPPETTPSAWHYVGPGLVQGLVIFALCTSPHFTKTDTFLSNFKAVTISSALWNACIFNPGIITGFISSLKEWRPTIQTPRLRLEQIQAGLIARQQAWLSNQNNATNTSNNSTPSVAWQQAQLQQIREQENQQESLPKHGSCAICLNELDGTLQETECKHIFHEQCLHTWRETNSTCPLCRASINYTIPNSLLVAA